MTSVAAGERLARDRARRSILPQGWQLYFLFGSLPLAWLLGLATFVWPVYAVFLLFALVVRGRVQAPRAFGLWLLFLAWVLLSGLEIESGERMLAFFYRASFYLSATVLFLYVLNSSERRLPTRTAVNALVVYWAAVVVGGFVAIALPGIAFHSAAEIVLQRLLPADVWSIRFVHDVLHPATAQVQRILDFPLPRPRTFFTYTNEWGSTLVVLTPFALFAARAARSAVARNVLRALLVLSVVPLTISLNRGAWIALLVLLPFAALLLARRRDFQGLRQLTLLAIVASCLILFTPLSSLIGARVEHGHSDEARISMNAAALDLAAASPVFGSGAPQPVVENPDAPSIGTHGQLVLVLVSQGIPGAVFFVLWFLYSLLRTGRRASDVGLWVQSSVVAFLVLAFFYELIPFQLHVVMAGLALAWREGCRRQSAA